MYQSHWPCCTIVFLTRMWHQGQEFQPPFLVHRLSYGSSTVTMGSFHVFECSTIRIQQHRYRHRFLITFVVFVDIDSEEIRHRFQPSSVHGESMDMKWKHDWESVDVMRRSRVRLTDRKERILSELLLKLWQRFIFSFEQTIWTGHFNEYITNQSGVDEGRIVRVEWCNQ